MDTLQRDVGAREEQEQRFVPLQVVEVDEQQASVTCDVRIEMNP